MDEILSKESLSAELHFWKNFPEHIGLVSVDILEDYDYLSDHREVLIHIYYVDTRDRWVHKMLWTTPFSVLKSEKEVIDEFLSEVAG